MSSQLSHQLVTPWQSSSPHHSPLHHNLPPTTWHVRKPAVVGDLQSTSTVTTPSPSSSSSSSPSSTSNQSHQPPTKWQLDQYHNTQPITPPTTPPHQPQSVRTLPRCGVVNFRKDGDSLRWAPRVTHNSSGVAARVHNFEDAFSLEEFSSRALPGVWRSTGGNPRLSDITKSNGPHSRIPAHSTRSLPGNSDNSQPTSPSPHRSSQPMEHTSMPMSNSERALVRNSSVKKAVVLATEVHRPSFWSIIAHTTKYQRSKAKARLQKDAKKRVDNTTKRPQLRPSPDSCVLNRSPKGGTGTVNIDDSLGVQQPLERPSRRKVTKSSQSGKATKRAPNRSDKKSGSLFQRLLWHLDKRNRKKSCLEDTTRGDSTERKQMSDGTNGSSCVAKGDNLTGRCGRRAMTGLSGNLVSRRTTGGREVGRVASHGDQYVTFITSES